MDEHVYIKKEPDWGREEEERESLLPDDCVVAPASTRDRSELSGIDHIAQSSYSAAVNLAHGVKEETKMAAVSTEVDFDRIIPQFVCAPDLDPLLGSDPAPSTTQCEAPPLEPVTIKQEQLPAPEYTSTEDQGVLSPSVPGRFVFCPVIGSPFVDRGSLKREPCDTVEESSGRVGGFRSSDVDPTTIITAKYPCAVCKAVLRSTLALKQHLVLVHGTGCKYRRERSEGGPGVVDGGSGVDTAEGRESGIGSSLQSSYARLKPFACDFCAARFVRKPEMAIHRRSHTGGNPFACDMCEATFHKVSAMRAHRATHSRDRPHRCGLCDARFSHAGSLAHHARSHVGGASHACDTCDARFATAFSLARHAKIHSGARPHVCVACGVRFAEKGDLVSHGAEHASEEL